MSNLLQPKKSKYRKAHKGRTRVKASRGNEIAFGSFALKAMGEKWVTNAQIEACRKSISKVLKRKGKFWLRIFPHKPITSKGSEVPMGGGKGAVDHYVFPVEEGRILFELDGIDEETAREAFRQASVRLPLKVKFIKKES